MCGVFSGKCCKNEVVMFRQHYVYCSLFFPFCEGKADFIEL